ncbi:MAG: hypothetical protein JOZ69_11480, partial [Myxococcales bacterium]|nr:hypothetical protein [Myxococcales bacterium]
MRPHISGPVAALTAAAFLTAVPAAAQRRGAPRRPPQAEPKSQQAPKDEGDEDHGSLLRTEPMVSPPADPLAVSPEVQSRIGSDWQLGPPPPEGAR